MKKRWLGILLALCLLVCLAPAALATETDPSVGLAEVYVSVTGDDTTGDGSEKKPYATLATAVDKAQDGATIYVMSDLTMTKCARYYGKDLTITSGEGVPYTVTRSDEFDILSDTARSWYNPAMIEVGSTEGRGTASLTLTNITFDDDGKKEGEYFIQADSEGDGETVFGKETIGHGKIVQDAIIATYNGTGTITLGEGAVLKNFGGMSAVRLSDGELVMKSGSVIMDDKDLPARTKGTTIQGAETGLYGPAGAVWMQGGTITMEEGSEIAGIDGRAIYNEAGEALINGTISGVTSSSAMWQGTGGAVMHMRVNATATFGPTAVIDGKGVTLLGSGIGVLGGCKLTMENGSLIKNYNANVLDIGGEAYLNGEITGLTGGGHAIVCQNWDTDGTHYIRIGESGYIHDNVCGYGVIYLQGASGVIDIYGKINDNISTDRGGALVLANNGTHVEANMYDGAEMCNNVSYQTGGALLVSCGTFTMNGGTISGNISGVGNNVGTKDQVGGGVYVRRGGQFIMNGGTIADNFAAGAGGNLSVSTETYNSVPDTTYGPAYVQLNGGTISGGTMNAEVTQAEDGSYTATGGQTNDLSVTSDVYGKITNYLTVSENATIGNPDVYMQKYDFTLIDPQRGTKLGNASTNGETALKKASTEKGWSNTLLASFWAQADNSQTWVLSGLEKAADKEKLPVYALVMPTNAEGNVGTNTKAAVYAVTVNADGTWSFTVPAGETNGYVVGLVQPTKDYGTLTLVADPATLTEDVGGTVNYTATYKPADNLINQLGGSESFTLTITLAPGMTYVADSGSGLTYNEATHTLTMQVSTEKLKRDITVSFSATAPDTIKAGETFVTNAVLEGTITVQDSKTTVTLVDTATVTVTAKPEDPIEPTDPPYIPPVDPDEPADPDDTGVSDLLNTEDHIQYLFGYPDGTFGPENNMTRAEVAQMFYNLLLDQDVTITKTFDDVPANAWYTKAVNTLASLDIISGVGDNKFEPERSITRAEFTAMAMKFAVGGEEGENIFSDVDEDDWFYDAVVNSIQYGWIHGYGDGTFRPNNPITRAEVTAIVNNMLGRAADEDFVDEHAEDLTPFSDIEKHWAYYHIVEATNDHNYTKPSSGENWTKLN